MRALPRRQAERCREERQWERQAERHVPQCRHLGVGPMHQHRDQSRRPLKARNHTGIRSPQLVAQHSARLGACWTQKYQHARARAKHRGRHVGSRSRGGQGRTGCGRGDPLLAASAPGAFATTFGWLFMTVTVSSVPCPAACTRSESAARPGGGGGGDRRRQTADDDDRDDRPFGWQQELERGRGRAPGRGGEGLVSRTSKVSQASTHRRACQICAGPAWCAACAHSRAHKKRLAVGLARLSRRLQWVQRVKQRTGWRAALKEGGPGWRWPARVVGGVGAPATGA